MKKNNIIHAAVHLIVSVVSNTISNMMPSKKHRFQNGSYVELMGELHFDLEKQKYNYKKFWIKRFKPKKMSNTRW